MFHGNVAPFTSVHTFCRTTNFFSYYIQHCFICRPSDSTVPTDAGIEPRTVAIGAMAVRRYYHQARSHQLMNIIIFLYYFSGKFLFAKSRCSEGVGIIRGAENNARPSISLQIQYLTFYNRGIYIFFQIYERTKYGAKGSWSEQCHYVALENLRVIFKKKKKVCRSFIN